jgi:hypothetical protein
MGAGIRVEEAEMDLGFAGFCRDLTRFAGLDFLYVSDCK